MLEKVYIVYGSYSSYYHDFETYEDIEQTEVKIYGVYTSEEVAKQEAKGNGLDYIGVELNTFLNDQREFWCEKEESEEYLKSKNPIILDFLTLTLEEIFIYEMEVLGYEFNQVV